MDGLCYFRTCEQWVLHPLLRKWDKVTNRLFRVCVCLFVYSFMYSTILLLIGCLLKGRETSKLEQTGKGRGGKLFFEALHFGQTKRWDFSASSRTLSSGVSMEPIAPGVGMGNMLIRALRIFTTKMWYLSSTLEIRTVPRSSHPLLLVEGSNSQADFLVGLKASIFLEMSRESSTGEDV